MFKPRNKKAHGVADTNNLWQRDIRRHVRKGCDAIVNNLGSVMPPMDQEFTDKQSEASRIINSCHDLSAMIAMNVKSLKKDNVLHHSAKEVADAVQGLRDSYTAFCDKHESHKRIMFGSFDEIKGLPYDGILDNDPLSPVVTQDIETPEDAPEPATAPEEADTSADTPEAPEEAENVSEEVTEEPEEKPKRMKRVPNAAKTAKKNAKKKRAKKPKAPKPAKDPIPKQVAAMRRMATNWKKISDDVSIEKISIADLEKGDKILVPFNKDVEPGLADDETLSVALSVKGIERAESTVKVVVAKTVYRFTFDEDEEIQRVTAADFKLRKKTVCPTCGATAETTAEAEEVFGWRKMGLRKVPQSYCKVCRGKHAKAKRDALKAERLREKAATLEEAFEAAPEAAPEAQA